LDSRHIPLIKASPNHPAKATLMLTDLIEQRQQILICYSPYNHLKGIDEILIFDHTVRERILAYENKPDHFGWTTVISGEPHHILFRHLKWDSDFNQIPTFKMEYILFGHDRIGLLMDAVSRFVEHLFSDGPKYCFFEIPSEDILMIQALNLCRFRLTETRLHHYLSNLEQFHHPRFRVRRAGQEDIPTLCEVAKNSRNPYDRLHADAFFENHLADEYLATFVANAVNGFSDLVLVPDEPGVPSKAFLAANIRDNASDGLCTKISRLALAAVDPACKGWFSKLTSEFVYLARGAGSQFAMTTTQATNRGSIRSFEKLGFRLGSVSHIFSISTRQQ